MAPFYDNPGQVNDEAISLAGGKTFQVIQLADSEGNIINPASGEIVFNGDLVIGSEVEVKNDSGNPIPVSDNGGSLTIDSTALGTANVASATSDTGTFPILALFKRLLEKITVVSGNVDGVGGTLTTIDADTGSIDGKLPSLVSNRVPVDGSGVTQPVSAASLPLPSGAATEAKQDTLNGYVDGIEGLLTTIDTDTGNIDGKLPSLSDNKFPVQLPYLVSANNSKTTGGLTENESWNASGSGDEILQYGTITVCVFSDRDSATNGLVFEASLDGTNWQTMESYSYKPSEGLESFSMAPSGRYFRVRFVNGVVASTFTRIQTLYRQGYTKSSSHRIGDVISAEKDAELVKSVLAAMKPNGAFTDIHCTAGGNLKISVEEVNGIDPLPTSVPVRTPATTSVASSDSSVTILAANSNRKGLTIFNSSTSTLALSYSSPATTSNSFIVLQSGGFFKLDQQLITGSAIYGIWASVNGTAQVTEYV
jgi:hypothetical protein